MDNSEFSALLEQLNLKPYQTNTFNCITNRFNEFVEMVVYKNDFNVTTGNFGGIDTITGELLIKSSDKTRKFVEIDGVLTPVVENAPKIEAVKHTIENSRKRALDNIYGYVLANYWDYFVTLTFDPAKVDRDNEEEIKYSWKKFRQKLQYLNEDVKLFAIPERHPKSGKLHLHCLVGAIKLDKYLSRAYNPHTNKPIFSNGRAVYNLTLFEYGFSTLVKITGNQLQVANYLTKYVIKDFGTIGYNKKSYYATQNLNFKNKQLSYLSTQGFIELQQNIKTDPFIEKIKETDKLIIYRYPLPKDEWGK